MRKRFLPIVGCGVVLLTILILVGLVGCDNKDNKDGIARYTMDITMDVASHTADITQKVSYSYREKEKTQSLYLVMNSNVFSDSMPVESYLLKKAYPNGKSFGKVEINSLSVEGYTVEHSLEGNILRMNLDKKVSKGDKIDIDISYRLTLPNTCLRYGYNNTSLNMANFYPQLMRADEYNPLGDPFYSACGEYAVNISFPEGQIIASTGEVVSDTTIDGMRKVSYSASNVRDFAFVLSAVMREISDEASGKKINYYYSSDKTPEKTMEWAKNAMNAFCDYFGEYTGDTLNICEVDFVHGGMEFSNIIFIAKDVVGEEKEKVVVHETAHQWWYNGVGSDQFNHPWQDEGLTEFSVILYYNYISDSDAAQKARWHAKTGIYEFEEFCRRSGIATDVSMDRPLSDFISGYEYTYLTYVKGMLMFDFIYDFMGEEKFLSACKAYYKKYKNRQASPENMIDIFNTHTKGIDRIFNAWLNGKMII